MYKYFDQIDVSEKTILIMKDPISKYSFAAANSGKYTV